MKLTLSFPELALARERIGTPLSSWSPGAATLDPREALIAELIEGIELDLGEIKAGPGGLLTYKGEQVILYIKDTRSSLWTLTNEPEKSRRFHVAECSTLEKMRSEGRFERYVVTNRMDGLFKVDWLDPDTRERGETEAALKVCKNCLNTLNWRGYQRSEDRLLLPEGRRLGKSEIWGSFSISEFLMDYATFFISKPGRRDTTAPPNVYVAEWPAISERMRRQANWRCGHCQVDLSDHPGLLHCHHRNGVVTDNSPSNLEVLCAIDHAAQPGHKHMRVSDVHRRTILAARARQGLG